VSSASVSAAVPQQQHQQQHVDFVPSTMLMLQLMHCVMQPSQMVIGVYAPAV
jgi:hypothetical protein